MINITIIAAVDDNLGFGNNCSMPWPRVAADLENFRSITSGYPIIMGRKTFESIGSAPLNARLNVVVSSNLECCNDSDVKVVPTLDSALSYIESKGYDEAFVIGGTSLISEASVFADRLLLTRIVGKYECDTYLDSHVINKFYAKSSKKLTVEGSSITAFYIEMCKTPIDRCKLSEDILESSNEFCGLVWDTLYASLTCSGYTYEGSEFKRTYDGIRVDTDHILSEFRILKVSNTPIWVLQVKSKFKINSTSLEKCDGTPKFDYYTVNIEDPVTGTLGIVGDIIRNFTYEVSEYRTEDIESIVGASLYSSLAFKYESHLRSDFCLELGREIAK